MSQRAAAICLWGLAFNITLPSDAREPWLAPSDSARQASPVSPDSAAIKRGKALYLDHCSDCHGNKGRGDGSNAADLEVRPSDLSRSAVLEQTDGELFWKISEGRKPMPGYGRKLSEEQRWQLIHYIRTLARSNSKGRNKQP